MMEERKKYLTDGDIEDILSPKCEFHPSPGFMEKVVEEAERTVLVRNRRKRLFWRLCSGVAAAVAVLCVLTTVLKNETADNVTIKQAAAKIETKSNNTSGVLKHVASKIKEEVHELPSLPQNKELATVKKQQKRVKQIENKKNIVSDNSMLAKNAHQSETTTEQLKDEPIKSYEDYEALSEIDRKPYIIKVRYEISENGSDGKVIRETACLCEGI